MQVAAMKKPDLSPAVVHKYAYELRYDFGFGYLDRCGDVLNSILREYAGWTVVGPITPAGTTLHHHDTGMVFTFDNSHLTLGQDQSEKVTTLVADNYFAEVAEKLTVATIERIDTEVFTRVGFRVWRLYGAGSKEDAQEALKALGFVPTGPLAAVAEDSTVEEVGFNCTFALPEMNLRLGVAVVEQNVVIDPATVLAAKALIREKDSRLRKAAAIDQLKARNAIAAFPHHAVLVDTDFSIDDPPIATDLKVSEFITEAFGKSTRVAGNLMRGKPSESD